MARPASELSVNPFLRVLLMGPAKLGKAERVDQPVLTPVGWRAIGELAVGDEVIGSNGKATHVVGVYPQGRKPLVRFVADDGAEVLCSEDHLWHTTTRRELDRGRYFQPRPSKNRSAPRRKIPTGRVGAGSVKTAKEVMLSIGDIHYLPRLSAPVRFSRECVLPIDPYLLGLLLGDGSLVENDVSFCKSDAVLLDAVIGLADSVGDRASIVHPTNGCPFVRIGNGEIRTQLRQLGLLGTYSDTKFVPESYLYAPPAVRLLLLRGLCDTDGCIVEGGTQAEFSTTSTRLRDAVVFIVRSLGGRAYVRSKQPVFSYKGEKKNGLPAWSVMISFEDGTCPFGLARKADAWKEDRERFWRQRVVSVEPAGEDECVCIAVDASDHLFVTKDFLLTHNSTVAITTSPAPVRVILCEDDSALRPALRITDKFSISEARKLDKGAFAEMQDVLLEAKNDAKAGKIKTVVVDPFSEFAHHLLEESFKNNPTGAGKDNGMVAYGEFGRRLDHILDYMLTIPCHLIVVSHYASESPELTGQIKKQGDGIVPLIPGKMRNRMGGKFVDILWFDVDPKDHDKRVLVTGPRGAWGPGCRSMHGAHILPADFNELIKTFAAQNKPQKAAVAQKPTTVAQRPANGVRR